MWPERLIFLKGALGSSSKIWHLHSGTIYGLEDLHKGGKRVETKSQKVLGVNSYVRWSYTSKSVGWAFYSFAPPNLISNRLMLNLNSFQEKKLSTLQKPELRHLKILRNKKYL